MDVTFELFLCFAYSPPLCPRMELIHTSGALIFATAAQGTPPDHLGLMTNSTNTCSLTGLWIFAHLKSCCLWVWLPISLNLSADCNLPLWDMDRSSHTLNKWELLQIEETTSAINKV